MKQFLLISIRRGLYKKSDLVQLFISIQHIKKNAMTDTDELTFCK